MRSYKQGSAYLSIGRRFYAIQRFLAVQFRRIAKEADNEAGRH
nr:MAG TPA: hypothetical protein [Caudoviricetes sp.]